jgi:CDP-glucose 4,6-dehydratase
LGHRLLVDGPAFAEAWNFGPKEMKGVSASELVEKLLTLWGSGSWTHVDPGYAQIETRQLRLSREKAADRLDWRPVYSWEDALVQIVDWFKAYQDSSTSGSSMYEVCRNHIDGYVDRAREQSLPWTGSG